MAENLPLLSHYKKKSSPTTAQSFRQFLSFLHHHFQLPIELIEKSLTELSSTINYAGGAPLAILSLADGWSKEKSTLIKPILAMGFAPMLLGVLLNQMTAVMQKHRLNQFKRDSRYCNHFFIEFTFLLKTIIMAYVFIVSHLGKNNDTADADTSLAIFLLLAGESAIPALGSMIYKIYRNHSPVENKKALWAGGIANTLTFGALLHNSTQIFFPNLNNNDGKRVMIDAAAFTTGGLLAFLRTKKPTATDFITDVLSAANVLYMLNELYKELKNDEETNQIQLGILLIIWCTILILPTLNTLAIKLFHHQHAKQYQNQQFLRSTINEYEYVTSSDDDEAYFRHKKIRTSIASSSEDNRDRSTSDNELERKPFYSTPLKSFALDLFSEFKKKENYPGNIDSFVNVINLKHPTFSKT